MLDNQKLRPCPFCAKPPDACPPGMEALVSCPDSACPGHMYWISHDQWNRRAIDEAGVERVAKILRCIGRGSSDEDLREAARGLVRAYLGLEVER